ncbi:MAG: hypothetical protein RIR01_2379 [Bacteroidota bacterium]|jgi:DNA-binding ferritin-like protein
MDAPKRNLLFSRQPVMQQTLKDCSSMTAACVSELMNARTAFHKLHLKITGPGSYAAHAALNEIYDALPGHADTLAEQYQGATCELLSYVEITPRTLNTKEEGIAYAKELKAMICELQEYMCYSEIVNDLDTAKSSINSLMYKLTFLS